MIHFHNAVKRLSRLSAQHEEKCVFQALSPLHSSPVCCGFFMPHPLDSTRQGSLGCAAVSVPPSAPSGGAQLTQSTPPTCPCCWSSVLSWRGSGTEAGEERKEKLHGGYKGKNIYDKLHGLNLCASPNLEIGVARRSSDMSQLCVPVLMKLWVTRELEMYLEGLVCVLIKQLLNSTV